ncbi:UDP-glucose 4-epimerase GalE [Caminibacter pacificus]|uniref:UDP-glucose 4-epimerase n=1 Tax=Caminibacter pacificus TaxID=1424653 RepID=A0AAJ4RBP5_9BACT|nr:UDP-glucose 4-epimerase GalE [Caminibacter pacificus]QCI29044.1 UDP-glucose 4-epimerase GalE [Caminibacter pacificus]ROR39139.1 UDP-glucose 4-epimerase [Caminibacter pacificus]
MNILITGGAGYIGSHVVKLLLENTDSDVTVIDNLVTGFESTIDELKKIRDFDFIKADLSNWNEIEGIFKARKFEAIIHFAASLIVPESVENPLKYYLNNTANTANLVKLANDYGVKKFVFSSTAATYGEPDISEIGNGIKEDFPTNPINPYGQSKLFSEKIIQDTAKANPEFKYVIFRYFNVAGAAPDLSIGQKTKNATHLIKVASECACGKRDGMYIFGTDYPTPDGTCIRDYIHVMDLADAHIKALEYLENNESDIFNVGYGKGASVKEVIDTVKKVSGVDFKVQDAPRRAGDPAMLISNCDKIKQKMNWTPKYDDLEFICKTAYEWEKKI